MVNIQKQRRGFTIVELLIVIVIIGILAAITVVAYNGISARGRDAQRRSDVVAITKALELYYIDNGEYPYGSGSTTINNGWSSTADASWQNFTDQLKPYMNTSLKDPTSTPNVAAQNGGYNYSYYGNRSTYCGASTKQMYIITYRLEAATQENIYKGDCPTNSLSYPASNYRVVK